MDTKICDITKWNNETLEVLDEAGAILRDGGLVAFPTETVYGLGANALDAEAVSSIYTAKGRPSDNPLIVHISDIAQCEMLALTWPESADKLAAAFWPGPLTIVLPKKEGVPTVTTGGLSTVAIRMPDHRAALELIKKAGCPIAAPSANLSGKPSPTKGAHVIADMSGRIPMILVGDDCKVGIESTVLDLTEETPLILRPGILTPEAIAEVLGTPVAFDPALYSGKEWNEDPSTEASATDEILEKEKKGPAPKAPGMKYKHYAPKAEMIVLKGSADGVQQALKKLKEEREATGQKVGILFFSAGDFAQAAHDFFAKLRAFDEDGVDLILAVAMDEADSMGFAIMNRMLKSASYKVMQIK